MFMIIEDKDSKTCLISPFDPVEFIRQTLHLRAGATKFEIVPGPHPMKEDEIAVRTRSVAAAIRWLSNYVPDPYGNPRQEAGKLLNDQDELLPLKVKASTEKPPGAFAAVKYRDYWFWIPQSHEHSKFSLIYLRVLLALADTAAKPSPPVLTIPTR